MKRLLCWIRGHKWRNVMFMGWKFIECSKCGKVEYLPEHIEIRNPV